MNSSGFSFMLPLYSDVGNAPVITQQPHDKFAEYYRYFSGEIFDEVIPAESDAEESAPEKYPVGLNLVKLLCMAQADATFGFWKESVVSFEPRQDTEISPADKAATAIVSNILNSSNINTLLWEMELDRQVYGGAVMRIMFDATVPGFIRWKRYPVQNFYPVWDNENEDEFLEVTVVSEISGQQAKLKYGIDTKSDVVPYVEHWTKREYKVTVGEKRVDVYSGINPWGFVPFVYIPRIRTTSWWGDALTEDIMRVQDELNGVLADLSEAANFNAHPIVWAINLPRKFNSKNYPVGPGLFWDFGRVIGQSPKPEVNLLEMKNPIPQGVFDYINFIYNYAQTSTFTPPVALGGDSGGSQRSGVTVEFRMSSLVHAIMRGRSYLGVGLNRSVTYSARILSQKELSSVSGHALRRIIEGQLGPVFAPIVPRDQPATVDEVQKGMSTPVPTISLETAVKNLGYGSSEVTRIKQMLADPALKELWNPKSMEQQKEPKGPNGSVAVTNEDRTPQEMSSSKNQS